MNEFNWPVAATLGVAIVTVAGVFLKLYTSSGNERLKHIQQRLDEIFRLLNDSNGNKGIISRVNLIESRQDDCLKRQEKG